MTRVLPAKKSPSATLGTAPPGDAPEWNGSQGEERRLLGRRTQTALATAAYLAFAVYLTWPLVTDLDSRIYGAVGDLTGAIATHRELVESGQFPFGSGTIEDFNAPDGLDLRWTLNVVTLPSFGALYVLSALFGPLPAVGIYTLLGFVTTGLAMFLLARRLLGNPAVAFLAGAVYAFYPFVVVKAQGHIDYVHGWVLVLVAWRLLELMESPSRRNGLLAGLALVLAFAWTPYHIVFAGVMGVAVGLVALAFAWRRRELGATAVALCIAASIGFAWLAAMVAIDRASPGSEVRSHTLQEVVAFSARAAEYVVPTAQHPLFGSQADSYRSDHLHGSNASESTLYLGVSVLVLALLGLFHGLRERGPTRRLAVAALALAVGGFAASSPPEVDLLGVTIPTTTKLLFEITSTWRVFSRLVVVVMLGLVLLAGLGLLALVRGRPRVAQIAIVALALAVVAADLWARPPGGGTNKIVVPPTYERLAELPDGIAVEYPLLPAESSSYGDVFYQGWHDKRILNGYRVGPDENRALRLTELDDPATADGLQALGIRYVLVRRDLEAAGLPDPGTPGRPYRFLTEDDYIALYELRQPGPQVLATPADGFGPPEVGPRQRSHWLVEPRGTIALRGSCAPCEGTVRLRVGTFERPRTVAVFAPGGRRLAQARIRPDATRLLSVRVRFDRQAELRIETSPGPEPISRATGSADPRSVSVNVGALSWKFARAQR